MKRWLMILLVASSVHVGFAQQNTPDAKTPAEITNSIGMKLMMIPAGEFMMGGGESAEDLVKDFAAYNRKSEYFKDEYPSHRVRITKPFYFGKYEVTIGQFRRFVEDSGYKTEAESDGTGGWGYDSALKKCTGRELKFNWQTPGFTQTDDQPVLDVTWNDAAAFCRWLSRKEGKIYRLPTEAEWEYSARAGTTTRYNVGDDPNELPKAANVIDAKGRTTFPHVQELDIPPDGHPKFTVPVGQFPPNRFGLCDMHGNVWEWCSDWYGEDYYAKSPVNDPTGPDIGNRRVRRGGAWNSFPLWARVTFRNWNTPWSRCVNLGFRVVRSAEEKQDGVTIELPPQQTADEPAKNEVSIVFAGDVMLDGGPGHSIVHGADPFAQFADILRGADVSVCNLECVLAPGGKQVLKPYTFRGPKESVPLLKKYFSAVCLANNHTGDFGKEAFAGQLKLLDEAGLPYFGGGRNRREARRPLILERNGMRVALLGANDFPPQAFEAGEDSPGVAWLTEHTILEDIQNAKTNDRADVVIPFLHWGEEGEPEPLKEQQQWARKMIDAGAAAVIGGHPHVTQTIETYQGKPIVYSLGNFVFDYFPYDPEVWTGWLVRLTIRRSGEVEMTKYVFEIDKTGTPHLSRKASP